MLDRDGFRPNVGIILLNQRNQVFWGKRIRTHSWQFPQGGIDRGETPEQAMFADWELIGVPHRVTLGDRGIKEGMVEYQHRRDSSAQSIALADIASHVKAQLLV